MKHSAADEWAFYQHRDKTWSWQSLTAPVSHSVGHFPGIVEAIADAVESGFKPGTSTITAVDMCRRLQPR